jgi:hypothetical protein
MSFSRWLRVNSEHYLLRDAQARLSHAYGLPRPPAEPHGADQLFWAHVFVPVYRSLPWGVRRWVMHQMPGSHRRTWTPQPRRHDPAI